MKRLLFACSLALVGTLALVAACKEGQGDRCQINDDCEFGLICSKATNTCESQGASAPQDAEIIDAVPADAAEPDAAALDAMPDAP